MSPEELLSPERPAFIGPTPQRDGIVIGLFDHLPIETPSKEKSVLGEVDLNTVQTPGRRETGGEISMESRLRGEKTPQSVSKRSLLASFMAVTPSNKRKFGEQGTPSSAAKGFGTPAFLRRHQPLVKIDEDEEPASRPAPWMRRSFGKSLSERMQAMRQDEEKRLDEDLDILHELEMEAEGMPPPKKAKVPEIQVEDSQLSMPLGPDRGLESEDDNEGEVEVELGPDGKPKRVWKKRGLKRQTRRVNSMIVPHPCVAITNEMAVKPNFTKSKPEPEFLHVDSDDDTARVAESQIDPFNILKDPDLSDFNDDDESDYASDASHSTKKRKTQTSKPKAASTSQAKDSEAHKEGPVKAAARKIKPWAHANFQRLKIRSKGGNGGKGRFGRKR